MSVRSLAALLAIAVMSCSRAAVPGTPVVAKGLLVEIPAGWRVVTPSSSMRAAQAVIDGPGGPAELAIFHFGANQGGDVESNIQRWLSQIAPDGRGVPRREALEANGLRITWVDAEGTLIGGTMGRPTTPLPGARLFGAVIEGKGGPWFIKATGPDATLAPQRLALLTMLQRARTEAERGT